jgi:hypothetical protein
MPIKLRQSQTQRIDRRSEKTTTTHYWMKGQTVDVLIEELVKCYETDDHGREVTKKGKGKLKMKILNELVRREVKPYKTHFKVSK